VPWAGCGEKAGAALFSRESDFIHVSGSPAFQLIPVGSVKIGESWGWSFGRCLARRRGRLFFQESPILSM
jgi:hypothetical protein